VVEVHGLAQQAATAGAQRMNAPAKQPKGRGRQDHATPDDFWDAVIRRFGPPSVDLAASQDNARAQFFFTEKDDALTKAWAPVCGGRHGWGWLNNPFANTAAWVKKCQEEAERGSRILQLCLAAVDSNWYAQRVEGRVYVEPLNPRITFQGETAGHMRPLMLLHWGWGYVGCRQWRWK